MATSISKGSSEHKAHLAGLTVAAKAGDKDAVANLKQHEPAKPVEVKETENKPK